jgi:hypothetical protein
MKRRNFLLAIGAAALGCNEKIVGPALRPPKPTPIPNVPEIVARQWKLGDVAYIPAAKQMCVCVMAGTDDTALWQPSDKWKGILEWQVLNS